MAEVLKVPKISDTVNEVTINNWLVREGDVLYQFYTPQSFGVKCYCSLVNAAEEKISLTYCHCSKGFVKKLWEEVLQRPVKVDLVQSVISGASECKFVIHL